MHHKILILLTYFERPELVRGFLRSLVRADRVYPHWELAFIDDGSVIPGRPVAEKILGNLVGKTRFINSRMTPEMKKICGGSFIGYYMNRAILESDADGVVVAG